MYVCVYIYTYIYVHIVYFSEKFNMYIYMLLKHIGTYHMIYDGTLMSIGENFAQKTSKKMVSSVLPSWSCLHHIVCTSSSANQTCWQWKV